MELCKMCISYIPFYTAQNNSKLKSTSKLDFQFAKIKYNKFPSLPYKLIKGKALPLGPGVPKPGGYWDISPQ